MLKHSAGNGAGLRTTQFCVRAVAEKIGERTHQRIVGVEESSPGKAQRTAIEQKGVIIRMAGGRRHEIEWQDRVLPTSRISPLRLLRGLREKCPPESFFEIGSQRFKLCRSRML